MSPYDKLDIQLTEMIKVITEEAINLKNAGDFHRAYILKEAANFLTRQKRNGIKNE
jgi:hypothetical protein